MKHYILILFWFNLLAWCDVGGMLKSQIDNSNNLNRVRGLGFLGLAASLVILGCFAFLKIGENNYTFRNLDSWHFGGLVFLTIIIILLFEKLIKSKSNSKKI